MKRSKIVSLLLSLSLLAALAVPGTLAQSAEAADGQEQENEGMEVDKYVTANDDGTYTITLEAYATGEKIITDTTKEVPTDIVLVLDQSGSMSSNNISTYSFRVYEDQNRPWETNYQTRNGDYYEVRHNGGEENLWYPLEDGGYASVSVVMTEGSMIYTQIGDERNNYYWNNRNNLYAYVNGELRKVDLTRESGDNWWEPDYYVYSLEDGTKIGRSEGIYGNPHFEGVDNNALYLASVDESTNQYTYKYIDESNEMHIIGTSIGAENKPDFGPFFERYQSGSITRLAALKNAVESFADSVSSKATGADGAYGTEDDIDHRIAVVGFASSGNNYNDEPYENTELFIGSSQYNYDDNASDNDASNYYGQALQDMSSANGRANIKDSIDEISAYGGTYPQHGMAMANGIFNANPVGEGETRNRVVVMFTDGWPGNGNYVNMTEAQDTVDEAVTAKETYHATVYTVGIFDGADPTSAGSSGDRASNNDKANWFMQNVSSNNGSPRDPSYYLSAADADTLNDIFEQISDEIEEGGASTTLDENAVIQDIIAPSFTLPEGTNTSDILLETYSYVGEDEWRKNQDAMGARATINGDTVSVTGFNFAENWCGTEEENGVETYRGSKLVISFDVVPKEGFLGGNNVPTNTRAGVYEDADDKDPVLEFPIPEANVPIGEVSVTAEDKNVYLLGDLTAEQIKSGDIALCGDVTLHLNADNYGLEPWQYEFVQIEVTYKGADGTEVTELTDLEDDTTYSIEVTVKPNEESTTGEGTANDMAGKTGSDEGSINVFKPELTFWDSEVYYGDNVPTDFTANKVSEIWKHGDTTSTDRGVDMTGEVPVLNIIYTPDDTKIQNGKVNTKQDVPVKTEVKIGTEDVQQYTTFVHQACNPACGWNETMLDGDPAFLLHVKTCQLTITKQGGANDEPYVFNVYKDGKKYTEVTIVGNNSETIYGLPVGTYTIQEDEDWSWRYNPSYDQSSVILNKDKEHDSITCTNSSNEDTWLNGYSPVVKNVYGVPHTEAND